MKIKPRVRKPHRSTTCPSCGVTVPATLWKDQVIAATTMPFWARLDLAWAVYPNCGAQLRSCVSSFAPAEPTLWTRDHELLCLERDYRVLHMAGALRAQP